MLEAVVAIAKLVGVGFFLGTGFRLSTHANLAVEQAIHKLRYSGDSSKRARRLVRSREECTGRAGASPEEFFGSHLADDVAIAVPGVLPKSQQVWRDTF